MAKKKNTNRVENTPEKKQGLVEVLGHLAKISGAWGGTLGTIIAVILSHWSKVLILSIGVFVGGLGVVAFSRATIDDGNFLSGIQDGLREFMAKEEMDKVLERRRELLVIIAELKELEQNREARIRKLIEKSNYALAIFQKIQIDADPPEAAGPPKIIGWLANSGGKGIFELNPHDPSLNKIPMKRLLSRLACFMTPKDTYAMIQDQARIAADMDVGKQAVAKVPLLFSKVGSFDLRGKTFFPYLVYETQPLKNSDGQTVSDLFIMYVETENYDFAENDIHTDYLADYDNLSIDEKEGFPVKCNSNS